MKEINMEVSYIEMADEPKIKAQFYQNVLVKLYHNSNLKKVRIVMSFGEEPPKDIKFGCLGGHLVKIPDGDAWLDVLVMRAVHDYTFWRRQGEILVFDYLPGDDELIEI